ncbi:NEDD4-binding protein 2 [Pristis pectinata]|uniref:NEDD4-binding protein 2 n=1 Tax=Pristis pectinata TaxID=685728 RepID=UPI00223E7956|nr:NEDD4-binding protein 2 [Pristis pectinata]
MPKKKKNITVSSPARPPGCGPPPSTSAAAPAAVDRAPVPSRASASSSMAAVAGAMGSGVNKEELLDRMTEMFSHLDPSVVYVVLSECDFKADDAMDSLLVLSDAAKGVKSSCSSGFECVAAALSDQVNGDNEVVMEDYGSNSVAASESFRWDEKLDPSIEIELEKYCMNTHYEQGTSFPQYHPFMNRYNSPINQFPSHYVGDQLPQLIQANLNSADGTHYSEQQTGSDASSPLRHLCTLNSKDCEENLSLHFNSENNIVEKRSEVQSEYDKFSSEAIERPSKNPSIEHGTVTVAFPTNIRTDGADIWTNQSESHGLSAAISMNIGAIGSKKYGGSEQLSPKYDTLPNAVNHQLQHLQSSDISDKAVGRFSGADGNEMWFGSKRERTSSENYKLFGEPQAFKGTNELLQKNVSLSKKSLKDEENVSKNMQQNTTCFPYWFDIGKDSSGENLPKLTNSEEASYPQYSNSVHFTNIPTMSPVSWNPWAPEFQPMSMAKTFITPVAMSPVKPRLSDTSPWKRAGPVSSPDTHHPVTSSGSNSLLSKPRLNPHGVQQSQTYEHSFPQLMNRKTMVTPKVLFLMRGLPGSGKSTLARTLVQQGPNGIILSTDEYFYRYGHYQFNPNLIGEAHQWNQKRAKEAMEKGLSPVIIDNTNTQSWEMKPYISMAFKYNYKVAFREPNTWWKFKPRELERRNVHGVSKEKIKTILDHYERHVTINTVMTSSQPTFPEKKAIELYPAESAEAGIINGATGPATSPNRQGSPCTLIPVLTCAEDWSAIKTNIASSDNLEQCLPSSANFPSESRKCETGHDTGSGTKYSEFISGDNVQKTDQMSGSDDSNYNFSSHSETEDGKRKLTVATVESEAEATESANQQDTDDLTLDNLPTAFSTSIDQKIGKESQNWQSAESTSNERVGTAKLPVEGNPSGESTSTKEESKVLEKSSNFESSSLNFVGDWPVIETLKPQDQRKRRIRKVSELSISNKDNVNQSSNLESVIPNDSLKKDTLSFIEQENVETSNESNGSQVSVDCSDDDMLFSPVENLTLESIYENGEDPKNPETSEVQISEALSEKHINKKSWQNRRMGKACKLALTFTSSSPIVEEFLEPVPLTSDQVENTVAIPEKSTQANSTQTAPDDFAVLWRIEKENTSFVEVKILTGTLNGIKPTDLDAIPKSINPNVSVPYRVTHDKSTYVDENDFANREENLQILSDCFKCIPFEDLNDLYEKCNKDVEWTTNLLLDSGMKLSNESPINNQSGLDHDLNSSSVAEKNEVPQTKKIDLSEESHDRSACETNQLSSADKKVTDVSGQSSETNAENDTLEWVQSCLDLETINPLPDNTREPVLVDEELKSPNDVLGNSRLTFNIGCEQFTNSSKEYNVGEKQSESMFKKNLVNNEVLCMKDDISVTSNENNIKETNNISECTDINETTPMSTPEADSVTEDQPNSDVGKISSQEENGKEVKTIKDGNTNQDGLGLYSDPMQIQSLELSLPPELAIQLNDLFGSVGLDPDSLTPEECVVQIDLNLAKIIHQKWKETILERKKEESLSYQLLLEGGNLSENLTWKLEGELEEEEPYVSSPLKYDNKQPKTKSRRKVVPLSASLTAKTDGVEGFPFMDHWSAQVPSVSLRDIMSEEMDFETKQHQSFMNSVLSTKDCATKLKEKRLLEMFPGIDKHFIMDMYKDNNYSFEQTRQFLKSLFDCDLESTKAIKVHEGTHQTELTVSKNKDKAVMTKDIKESRSEHVFQDVEYPDYEDFRVEAALHRRKQQDCFSKAAAAHGRNMKAVATYYAQQGHLHGEKMKEANHRAAIKIFKQVNASLLPQNVLDLHGLHVDEALQCLEEVLFQKINEYQQRGGKSYLSVITGRGRHSQGGVARIKPVVIDYLKRQNFRFMEPQQGVVKIKLK